MNRYLVLMGLCVFFCGMSFGLELVNFKDKPEISVYKGEENKAAVSSEDVESEGACGVIEWQAFSKNFIELYFDKSYKIPVDKIDGVIKLKVLADNDSFYKLAVRMTDRSGEVFHWDAKVKVEPEKWQEISVPLVAGKEKASWGGNKDKKIDYPMSLKGIAIYVKRKDKGGKLKIKDISYEPASKDQLKQTIVPVSILEFYVEPETQARLSFDTEGFNDTQAVAYSITNYHGKEVVSDKAVISKKKSYPFL